MNGISIFMYHQVGRFAEMREHRASYCDTDRFRGHLRYLKFIGAHVMSMSAAVAALDGDQPIPPRAVVLTFDDGCENFYENALPILQEYGFPAIVYAIAGMTGKSAQWLAASGHPTPPLMTDARLREVAASGVEIGSHAYGHIHLAGLPETSLRHEVSDSKRRLEDVLGRPVEHFCYPYGSHDLAAILATAEAGYRSAVTCQRGAATSAFDVLALPRKGVSYGDDAIGFAWKLHMKNKPKGLALSRNQAAERQHL